MRKLHDRIGEPRDDVPARGLRRLFRGNRLGGNSFQGFRAFREKSDCDGQDSRLGGELVPEGIVLPGGFRRAFFQFVKHRGQLRKGRGDTVRVVMFSRRDIRVRHEFRDVRPPWVVLRQNCVLIIQFAIETPFQKVIRTRLERFGE